MAWTYELMLVVLLWILNTTEGKDAQVTCIISEHCILPCTFTPGDDVVIHWHNMKNKDNSAHTYYLGRDQLAYQDTKYSGRTSLFTGLISSGNASLMLKDVKIQDEGRYKCYTSTVKGNDEQFVNVEVEVPLTSVDITVVSDTVTCHSEGIYPLPTLAWSTDPPSQIQPEKAPETQKNDKGLFSITSSMQKTSNDTYICTITAGQTTRTSSWKQQNLRAKGGEDLIIPCSVPEANTNLKDFTLTWLFNRDTEVLTFDSHLSQSEVHGRWRGHVKYTPKQTEIKLHNLNDNTLSGTYSCEVVTTKFRYFEQTDVLLPEIGSGAIHPAVTAVFVIVGIIIIAMVTIALVYLKCIKKAKPSSVTPSSQESALKMTDKPSSENGNTDQHESQTLTGKNE